MSTLGSYAGDASRRYVGLQVVSGYNCTLTMKRLLKFEFISSVPNFILIALFLCVKVKQLFRGNSIAPGNQTSIQSPSNFRMQDSRLCIAKKGLLFIMAQDMCALWTNGRKRPLEFHTKNLGPNIVCVYIVLNIYAP